MSCYLFLQQFSEGICLKDIFGLNIQQSITVRKEGVQNGKPSFNTISKNGVAVMLELCSATSLTGGGMEIGVWVKPLVSSDLLIIKV